MYEYVYVYEKRSDKPYFLIHHQKTMQPLGQARKPIKCAEHVFNYAVNMCLNKSMCVYIYVYV